MVRHALRPEGIDHDECRREPVVAQGIENAADYVLKRSVMDGAADIARNQSRGRPLGDQAVKVRVPVGIFLNEHKDQFAMSETFLMGSCGFEGNKW